MVNLLLDVRRLGTPVAMLSNATTRLWADLDHHGLRARFDRVFCSADIGLAKPDSRAYAYVAGALSVRLDELAYIDDTLSWVEAASREGIRGHRYTTPENARAFLHALELL
jgi:putative hydrolase of the HAD superfamily